MEKLIEKAVETAMETFVETVDHHRKLEEDLKELESEFRRLKRRKVDINSTIEAEVRPGKRVKTEVTGWLKDVEEIEKDIEDVKTRVHNGVPLLERAGLDKRVREKIEVVKGIYERGIFNEGLVIARPPASGIKIPIGELEGEISTKGKIWEYLMGDEIGMIGVCGIGGVGKTTIMKHVNNDLLGENRFEKVIWVTVSYPLNVLALQKNIALAMGETLGDDDQEQTRRAATLMDIMGRVRFVLILDDVWENFPLMDVGIPDPKVHKGCKVIVTSRSIEVCNYLDCQIVKVQPLSPEESRNLFLNKVGHGVLQISGLEEILKLIVKECSGLPLAIIVIAGSMKGVNDIKVWRNALTELQEHVKSVKGSDDEIFVQLRFSFDHLANAEIKNCFLYCSLFREDYCFSREDLIEDWIDEGLMDGFKRREAAHDKGHAILDMLEKNCLLEKYFQEEEDEYVRMHDVVRDMAIKSIGPEVGYMVKAGMKLTEVPKEHEWTIDLNKVSLMANDISKIPVGLSPKCPLLSTLILSDNPLKEIPKSFFEDMNGLKVLNLSRTNIEALPGSISKLESLSTLRLRSCKRLKCLPSLEKLVALRKLDLRKAGIKVVPQGMEMLISLEYLDIFCPYLEEIPTGILPKLSSLQYLVTVGDDGENSVKITFEEVARLRNLEILNCNFDDVQDFNYLMSEFKNFHSLTAYELVVGTRADSLIAPPSDPNHKYKLTISGCDIGEECIVLPDKLQHLMIRQCKNMRSSLNKTALLENATELGHCIISNCKETEYVVELDSSSSSSFCSPMLDKLELLCLWSLPRLWELVRVEGVATAARVFSNLKGLELIGCSRMRKLFPLELLRAFQNLEEIYVHDCEEMQEIIASSDSDASSSDKLPFTFPKLSRLILMCLPQLKSICSAKGVMVCDSIKEIWICKCHELKRIPVRLPLLGNDQPSPPPHLKRILIHKESKEWWESVVEWDYPKAKSVLQPFLEYTR